MLIKVTQNGVSRMVETGTPATAKPPRVTDAQIVHDYLGGALLRNIGLVYGISEPKLRKIIDAGTTKEQRDAVEQEHHRRRQRDFSRRRNAAR